MTQYYSGTTVIITDTLTDEDGDAFTPTSIEITIEDSSGTKLVDGETMSSTGTAGEYEYSYTTSAGSADTLEYTITATNAIGEVTVIRGLFEVV